MRDGGFIILGRESSGKVKKPLLPYEEVTVDSKLIIGLGPIMITVAVWADNAPYISEKRNGFLFFIFLMIH